MSELDYALQEFAERQEAGGPSGTAFIDDLETRKNGDINEIRIWAGNAVDAIEVYYSGVPGRKHGGSGGHRKILTVPAGWRITEIETWTGDQPHGGGLSRVLKGLRFIMSPISSGGASQTSEVFGLDEGEYKKIRSAKGFPLRSISGSAGVLLDRLSFDFGYLFELTNARINAKNISERLKNARPIHHRVDELVNGTSNVQSKNASFRYAVSDDYEVHWAGETRLALGLSVSLEGSIELPGLTGTMTNEFTAEISQTFNYGERRATRKENAYAYESPMIAGPRTAVAVEFTIMAADLEELEVLYDVIFYESTIDKPHKVVPTSFKISGKIASLESITRMLERKLTEEELNEA